MKLKTPIYISPAVEVQRRFYGFSLLIWRSLAFQFTERNGLDHPLSTEYKMDREVLGFCMHKRREDLQ